MKFLLLFVALAIAPTAGAMEMFHPQAPSWQAHAFTGTGFETDPDSTGSPVIMTREGYEPHVKRGKDRAEKKLQAGFGAVAGICYIQAAGGKLMAHTGSVPAGGVKVTLTGAGTSSTAITDASGFFAFSAAPGEYTVEARGVTMKVTVVGNKTTLIPLRCGKRMSD